MPQTQGERLAANGMVCPAGPPTVAVPEDEPREITMGEFMGHDEKRRHITEAEEAQGRVEPFSLDWTLQILSVC